MLSKLLLWVAALLFCAAWWSVFFNLTAFVVLLIISMIVGTWSEFLDRRQPAPRYSEQPRRPVVIQANRDSLRRDPQAYPLTNRAIWPDEIGAPE